MYSGIRAIACATVVASFLPAAPTAGDEEVYKSEDEEGNVIYQDQPVSGDAAEVTGETQGALQSSAAGRSVVLYAARGCAPCDKVRALLVEHRVPFQEQNPLDSPAVEAELERIAGSGDVPVLLVGDQVVAGYDERAILNALEIAGVDVRVGGTAARSGNESLTREDLEAMTPEEIEQAARDALARGEDNDLFEPDEGYFHGFGEEENRGNDLR